MPGFEVHGFEPESWKIRAEEPMTVFIAWRALPPAATSAREIVKEKSLMLKRVQQLFEEPLEGLRMAMVRFPHATGQGEEEGRAVAGLGEIRHLGDGEPLLIPAQPSFRRAVLRQGDRLTDPQMVYVTPTPGPR
jgi:hypothetical protein